MTADGHETYLPNRDWILCDTYPAGNERTCRIRISITFPATGEFHSACFTRHPHITTLGGADTHPRPKPRRANSGYRFARRANGTSTTPVRHKFDRELKIVSA